MLKTIQIDNLSETELDARIFSAVERAFQQFGYSAQQESRKRLPIGIDRACEITGLAKPTIYALAPKGGIPNFKQGKKLYFYEDELLAWIQMGRRLSPAYIDTQADSALKIKGRSQSITSNTKAK